ncbi:unnamed protein product [Callosobruchus maculatus]|uniref:Kinesin motor domain-containing protein n=1 Tax=Callosobruchus maculatus TaxID=64391 RepID=A0A653D5N0_CALMS|nr:unnamed protein product [Callosobruchus maculatus]
MNIIITINPSLEMFDESQHALNFAAIAQEIVIVEKPVRLVRNRFSEMLEKKEIVPSVVQRVEPREDVDRLQKELQRCQEQIMELQLHIMHMETEYRMELERTVDQAAVGFRNIWESRLQRVQENAKNERQRLIDYYEEKIRHLPTDVIEISGSSSDEELDEKDNMLKDAEEFVRDLQSQMLQLREANNKLLIRNMQLEEENAKLEEQLLVYQQTLPLNTHHTDISDENSEEEGALNPFH